MRLTVNQDYVGSKPTSTANLTSKQTEKKKETDRYDFEIKNRNKFKHELETDR